MLRLPFGGLSRLHHCVVISAESRTGKRHDESIEKALGDLPEKAAGRVTDDSARLVPGPRA